MFYGIMYAKLLSYINMSAPYTKIFDILSGDPSDDSILQTIGEVQSKYANDPDVAARLAMKLATSGDIISPSGDLVADVASTGGPSSLSTIISPLFLRSAGAVVPKLGVPGRPAGGIDCLAQIPNYRSMLTTKEVNQILESSGYAHFLAGDQFAPLDRRMFHLRQETDALAVPGLVTASLLAKKLAVGIKHAGLDIRVSSFGNFGSDRLSATENARLFLKTAKLVGIEATPVLTDGQYPYQPYIGRSEALVALDDIFEGNMSSWLLNHCTMCRTLVLACITEEYRTNVIDAGREVLQFHFNQNLIAQGSNPERFKELVQKTRQDHQLQIRAEYSGFSYYSLGNIRKVIARYQQYQTSVSNMFPDPIGLIFLHPPGTWVDKNEPLATLRAPKMKQNEFFDQLRPSISKPTASPRALGVEGIYG